MARSLITVENKLDGMLIEPLSEIGFKRVQSLIYQRQIPTISQMLRFPARSRGNSALINANAAIRFEEVEKLLGNTDPLFPTFMVPAHFLRPEKTYGEWVFFPEAPGEVIERILTTCTEYLLPLIGRFNTLVSLKLQLLSEINHYAVLREKRVRLGSEEERTMFDIANMNENNLRLPLNSGQRIEKLAAIYVLEGMKDAARLLIDSQLAELRVAKPLPPHVAQYARWERLKTTLLQ